MRQRIYVVEDDVALQELYVYTLESEFDCRVFDGGEAFFRMLAEEVPSLVILDIMLPGDDGFGILSRLKADKGTAHVPVIIVSARGEEISKVKGLNMGADDYIAKPFGVLELVARIKANLRKNLKAAGGDVAYKDIFVDSARHQIRVNGKEIHTTLKEYNLLCLLCENAEVVQEREVIFNEVWGEGFIGETRTLDIHIKGVRKKLAEAGSEALIRTVRGVGYLLV